MLASLSVACGGDTTPGDQEAGPTSTDSVGMGGTPVLIDDPATADFGIPAWSRLGEPWFGDLDAMVERRVIRAAVVHSKTLFFLDGARPRGITYEALTRFEGFLNTRLGTEHLKVHVAVVPLERAQLLPALAEGRVDISAANLTVTPERLETVDFAEPLLSDVPELLVTHIDAASPASLEEMSGMEIHVRRSSSYFQSLSSLNEDLREKGLAPARVVAASELLETEDLLELVDAGVIPATIVDKHLADFWAQVFGNLRVHDDLRVREGGTIAWAIRKGSPELVEVLRDFAREHRSGTLLGNMALKRYLRDADYVAAPRGRADQQNLEAALPHFRRYAEEYGFDPLLLVAQAYQESGLDQDAVSTVGAVGFMQLMPSTAADPNVGIPDITRLEDNIHAGAKYLRFLLERYFSGAELDPLNEHFFAFAAYNAGPARVARLRAEAAEAGLDPDTWFRNVEHVAARRIGRETVQYVSNIYKYYLAYTRIQALERR